MSKVTALRVYLSVLLLAQALSQNCYSDSLTEDEIKSKSSNCTGRSCTLNGTSGVNYFFPHLSFTCNGTLVNWTMAGNLTYGPVSTNPTLIIWRPTTKDSKEYKIQQQTSLTYCNGERMEETSPQVYTCELQNGLPVEEGDIIGIEVPYYAAMSDIFDPYFDHKTSDQPKIHYIHGTSITFFNLSQSMSINGLPLLTVGVNPLDTKESTSDNTDGNPATPSSQASRYTPTLKPIRYPRTSRPISFNAPRSTSEPNDDDYRTIVLQLPQKIGIALGAIFLFAALILLVAIQCCVIVRIRKNRRDKIMSKERGLSLSSTEPYARVDLNGTEISNNNGQTVKNRGLSLSSTEPYAMVDLNGMEISKNSGQTSKDRGLSLSSTEPYARLDLREIEIASFSYPPNQLEQRNSHIPVSRNPSYATISTPTLVYSSGDTYSMYVSRADIRIRDGSYTVEDMERHQFDQQGMETSNVTRLSPMVNRDEDNHSAQQLISPSSSVGNMTLEDHHKHLDDADSGIHIYRHDTNRESYFDNGSEHIYY